MKHREKCHVLYRCIYNELKISNCNPHNMIEYAAVNDETNNNTYVLVSSSAEHDINDNGNVIYNCFTRLLCVVINESHYKPCRALTRLIMIFSWFRVVLLSSNILQLEPSTLPRCDAADVRVGYTDMARGCTAGALTAEPRRRWSSAVLHVMLKRRHT